MNIIEWGRSIVKLHCGARVVMGMYRHAVTACGGRSCRADRFREASREKSVEGRTCGSALTDIRVKTPVCLYVWRAVIVCGQIVEDNSREICSSVQI